MRLASRGTRETEDGGTEEIRDDPLADALRRQARRIHVQALLLAMGATLLAVLLPL